MATPVVGGLMKSLVGALLGITLLIGCASSIESGRDAFHGGHVLVNESREAGRIMIKPGTSFDPFQGNGRTCASCHKAQDRFGMSKMTRDALDRSDPFFYPGLDEDQALLREHGLVHVIADGRDEFRQTPALNHLCKVCDDNGSCESLGLNGDRVPSLHAFTVGAIINHSAKTTARQPGEDFVIPDADLIDDIVKYMLSSDVCRSEQ